MLLRARWEAVPSWQLPLSRLQHLVGTWEYIAWSTQRFGRVWVGAGVGAGGATSGGPGAGLG